MASSDQFSPTEEPSEDSRCPCGSGRSWTTCCSEQQAGTPTANDPRQTLKVLFFLTLASFFLGLLFFWPFLEEEHRRMNPSMVWLVWVGDGFGLAWFTWYFTKHAVLGEPFRYGTAQSHRMRLDWWLALVTLTAAIGSDLWITYQLGAEERNGFARAVVVLGEIGSVEKKSAAKFHRYLIRCRFQDGQGAWQEGQFTLLEERNTEQFEDDLPVVVPVLPARNWIADIHPNDGNRFYMMAGCIRLFQGIAIFNFVVFLREAVKKHGRLPWWFDLHMALPFMVESAFLGVTGGLIRGLGFLVDCVFN